ncbi:efflux RND transporter periplasmic adaptor subunit [Mangrovicoccus sp. HB161399]|uniref:efflux RND transporter periplasmic adaptor subunit n=1 Tax=Mangrovicoccus sp. HB161399 TaxID=2720392 RepID=UPI001553A94B|nr:HlyD family efflux transporter periplasmic adaptor subunit [Mangrovicoccus sp. HB161399]
MGFLRRIMVGLVLMALSLGALSLAVYKVVGAVRAAMTDEAPVRPPREVVRSVNVVPYATGEHRPVLTTYGQIQSRRTLEIRATAGGTAVELAPEFEEGGRVSEGQLLVKIDPAPAQAELDVARADLAEAEADLRDAERSLDLAKEDLAAAEEQYQLRQKAQVRQQDLVGRGVGSAALVEEAALSASSARQAEVSARQALATAEARIDTARSVRTRAEIAVSEAARTLSETEIRARFAGTLSGVTLVEGGLVSSNEMLAELVDPDTLEVAFRLSTAQHARLLDADGRLIGLPVSAVLDVAGLELSVPGVIDREAAVVGDGQTGRLVYARLERASGLRPGDFVTVKVEEPLLQDVAELPSTALGPNGTVLALGAEDRLEEVPVELLRRQEDTVLVRAALEGRMVVSERTPLLGAGLKVRAAAPEPEAGAAAVPEAGAAAVPEMLVLDPERRARLVAFVEGSTTMPGEMKSRILTQLEADTVPAQVVERLESRMGS